MLRKISGIKGCNLFDPISKKILDKVDILIEGDIISKVSQDSIPFSNSDKVINAEGCTVIPGLMNLHSHPQRRHARKMSSSTPYRFGAAAVEDLPNTQRILLAVRNVLVEFIEEGVTTMRAAGSKDYLNIELRNVFNDGLFKGPRIISTGPIISQTGGHCTRGINGATEADGADEVLKTVRAAFKAGADWIKICVTGGHAGIHKGDDPRIPEFTEEEIQAAVEEAHTRGRRVMAHGCAAEGVKNAVKAGVDCIEHGTLLDDEAINMMVEAGTFLVPTLSGIRNVYERELAAGNKKIADLLWTVISPHEKTISKCIEAGILIGTGSDTLGDIYQEIEMLIKCGMTSSEALAAATINSAKILNLENEIGSVEEGKKADILILEGNPIDDIAALRKIREVIKGGEVFNSELLNIFDRTYI